MEMELSKTEMELSKTKMELWWLNLENREKRKGIGTDGGFFVARSFAMFLLCFTMFFALLVFLLLI